MTLTRIMTKPTLRGTLAALGQWQSLVARQGRRVYPFQLGCSVRSASTGTTVLTQGLGEFAQNDYFVVCQKVYYGDSYLFIPDTTRISKVTSDPDAATDDTLTISPAVTLYEGEWLLNIGADTATDPTSAPNYDGTDVNLYTDNAGNNANSNPYLLTAQNGDFSGWIDDDHPAVDLLVTDESGGEIVVIPLYAVGPSIQRL